MTFQRRVAHRGLLVVLALALATGCGAAARPDAGTSPGVITNQSLYRDLLTTADLPPGFVQLPEPTGGPCSPHLRPSPTAHAETVFGRGLGPNQVRILAEVAVFPSAQAAAMHLRALRQHFAHLVCTTPGRPGGLPALRGASSLVAAPFDGATASVGVVLATRFVGAMPAALRGFPPPGAYSEVVVTGRDLVEVTIAATMPDRRLVAVLTRTQVGRLTHAPPARCAVCTAA